MQKKKKKKKEKTQTCMEPATDELKLALMSLFGYDFLYIELEFVESIDDDEPIRDCRKSFLLLRFGDDSLLVLTEYRSIIIEVFFFNNLFITI